MGLIVWFANICGDEDQSEQSLRHKHVFSTRLAVIAAAQVPEKTSQAAVDAGDQSAGDAASSSSDEGDEPTADVPPAESLPRREISMLEECRGVENYEKLNRISEGTYGVVYRCVTCAVGPYFALTVRWKSVHY